MSGYTQRLSHLGLLDFHRTKEAIEDGKRAVEVVLPGLRTLIGELPSIEHRKKS